MKSRNTKNFLSVITLSALMLTSPLAMSQDYLDDADTVLNSEQIDIDGLYAEKPKETAADRIAKMRKKLEQQNEQMVQKKIEDIRVQEEMKLTKKLQTAFSNGMNQMDNSNNTNNNADQVTTSQAAVVQASVQTVEAPVDNSIKNPNKIIPFFGIANFKGDKVDFESKISTGLSVEHQVSERFSAGISFNYSNMSITDVSNTYASYNYQSYNYYPYYNNGYYNTFGQGREMKFNKLNFEINSKFYITGQDSKIRPFIGLGVGYNRTTLKYNDNGMGYMYNNVNFGNEGYTSNFVNGTAMLGSEVNFTDSIGMVLDLRYAKSITNGFGTESDQGFQNPDQIRLENVGKAIEDSNLLSINLGFIVRF